METIKKQAAPKWAVVINGFNSYLSQDLLGGPKVVKMAWVINLHKLLTVFIIALFMILFNNYSTVAWVYLALHGTYSFCWLLKHVAFRDSRYETRVTIGGAVFFFLLLGTYWIAPYLLISDALGADRPAPSNWFLAICIALFVLGVTIMIASDCQKNFTLKFRQGLITDGMFRHVRHPNHLGEMMLYAAFALLVQHWLPWVVLAYWWTSVFLVTMLMIDSSLSRYTEWEAYKARTGLLLPWRFFVAKSK